jgi:UDPglucose 6-dehydrogenase
MRITIVGTGYVGLVAATCLAETGNDVLGLDVDEEKIKRLTRGESPIFEPGLGDLLERNLHEGRLTFTTNYEAGARHGQVIFLCLPTPPNADGSADTRHVLSAVREIARHMDGYKLFVLKSTVPIGTHEQVESAIKEIYKGQFSIAANPEFLKEGTAIEDFLKPDRVILGVTDDRSWEILHMLYEPFVRTGAPILRMDPASAGLAKYAANAFLATKISFMNEIAALCEKTGADVELVRVGMSKDTRIGNAFLFPGIGYGGSCFPKDTRALVQSGRKCNLQMRIVDAAEQVNEEQKLSLLSKIKKHFDGRLEGRQLAFWGLAFKPRTDDIREAPALALIEALLASHAKIRAFDPEAMPNVKKLFGNRIEFAANAYDALPQADALVLATEWNEFRSPDWERVKKLMRTPAIFDGRNIYQPRYLREEGFIYYGVGKP